MAHRAGQRRASWATQGIADGARPCCSTARASSTWCRRADPRCAPRRAHRPRRALLLPGFIDAQVNGGGGVLFNDAPERGRDPRHRRRAPALRHHRLPAHAHQRRPRHRRACHRGGARRRSRPGCRACSASISRARSSSLARKGVHDPAMLRELGPQRAWPADLAPRRPHAGHARARDDHARRSSRSWCSRGHRLRGAHQRHLRGDPRCPRRTGSRGFTHLFNAMSPLTGARARRGRRRARGHATAGAASSSTASTSTRWCCASRCAASATTASCWSPTPCPAWAPTSDHFVLQGRRITVRGHACLDEDGRLAGSNIDMASCVRNAVALLRRAARRGGAHGQPLPGEFLGLGARTRPHRARLPRQPRAGGRRTERQRDLDRRPPASGSAVAAGAR